LNSDESNNNSQQILSESDCVEDMMMIRKFI